MIARNLSPIVAPHRAHRHTLCPLIVARPAAAGCSRRGRSAVPSAVVAVALVVFFFGCASPQPLPPIAEYNPPPAGGDPSADPVSYETSPSLRWMIAVRAETGDERFLRAAERVEAAFNRLLRERRFAASVDLVFISDHRYREAFDAVVASSAASRPATVLAGDSASGAERGRGAALPTWGDPATIDLLWMDSGSLAPYARAVDENALVRLDRWYVDDRLVDPLSEWALQLEAAVPSTVWATARAADGVYGVPVQPSPVSVPGIAVRADILSAPDTAVYGDPTWPRTAAEVVGVVARAIRAQGDASRGGQSSGDQSSGGGPFAVWTAIPDASWLGLRSEGGFAVYSPFDTAPESLLDRPGYAALLDALLDAPLDTLPDAPASGAFEYRPVSASAAADAVLDGGAVAIVPYPYTPVSAPRLTARFGVDWVVLPLAVPTVAPLAARESIHGVVRRSAGSADRVRDALWLLQLVQTDSVLRTTLVHGVREIDYLLLDEEGPLIRPLSDRDYLPGIADRIGDAAGGPFATRDEAAIVAETAALVRFGAPSPEPGFAFDPNRTPVDPQRVREAAALPRDVVAAAADGRDVLAELRDRLHQAGLADLIRELDRQLTDSAVDRRR